MHSSNSYISEFLKVLENIISILFVFIQVCMKDYLAELSGSTADLSFGQLSFYYIRKLFITGNLNFINA